MKEGKIEKIILFDWFEKYTKYGRQIRSCNAVVAAVTDDSGTRSYVGGWVVAILNLGTSPCDDVTSFCQLKTKCV